MEVSETMIMSQEGGAMTLNVFTKITVINHYILYSGTNSDPERKFSNTSRAALVGTNLLYNIHYRQASFQIVNAPSPQSQRNIFYDISWMCQHPASTVYLMANKVASWHPVFSVWLFF